MNNWGAFSISILAVEAAVFLLAFALYLIHVFFSVSMDEEDEDAHEDETQYGSWLANMALEGNRFAALRQENVLGALAVLPVHVYGKKESSEEEGECAICLDNWKEEDFYKALPPCNHRFHEECIDEWLLNKLTCPLCRAELKLHYIDSMV